MPRNVPLNSQGIIEIIFIIRFEKMISGMYMGEIVRLVLCELTERKLLFQGVMSDELNEPNRFYTKYISEIERFVFTTAHFLRLS